jgi:hypothetical protein
MKEKQLQVKRMNLNVEIELHNRFKAATAAEGKNMTDVLIDYMRKYVEQHAPQQSKKGRRG